MNLREYFIVYSQLIVTALVVSPFFFLHVYFCLYIKDVFTDCGELELKDL